MDCRIRTGEECVSLEGLLGLLAQLRLIRIDSCRLGRESLDGLLSLTTTQAERAREVSLSSTCRRSCTSARPLAVNDDLPTVPGAQ